MREINKSSCWIPWKDFKITDTCELCGLVQTEVSISSFAGPMKQIFIGKYNDRSFVYCKNHTDIQVEKFKKKFIKKHGILL